MAATIKDLGKVTAYAYAKAAGYTGTEAEFQQVFNEFTENAPGLLDRLDDAVADAEAAQTAAETAVTNANTAKTAAETAQAAAEQAAQDMGDSVQQITTNANDISDLKGLTNNYIHANEKVNYDSVILPGTDGEYNSSAITVKRNSGALILVNGTNNANNLRIPLTGTSVDISTSAPSPTNRPLWYVEDIADFVVGHEYEAKISLVSGEMALTDPTHKMSITVRNTNTLNKSFENNTTWLCTEKPQMACIVIRPGTYTNAVFLVQIIDITISHSKAMERYVKKASYSENGLYKMLNGGYNRAGNILGTTNSRYYLITGDYLSDNVKSVEANNGYKMTVLAFNNNAFAGFLSGENTLTTDSTQGIYWADNLNFESLRIAYPNYKFKIELAQSETASGTLTPISESKASNMTLYCYQNISIKPYYAEEMDKTIADSYSTITEKALVFPVVTDIHFMSSTNLSTLFNNCADNIRYLCKNLVCDFVLNLGDNTDGNQSPDVTIQRNKYMEMQFAKIGVPYFGVIGNHDCNGYSSTTKLTGKETFISYLANTKGASFDTQASEHHFNFFKDFDNLGVRVLVLDANYLATYRYHTSTASWLTNVALNTNNMVLLCEHLSSIGTQNWSGTVPNYGEDVTTALQTFVNNGGTLVQLCGHSHADYYFNSPWLTVYSCCQKLEENDTTTGGFLQISGNVGGNAGIVSPARAMGTETEDLWSVCVLKPLSEEIDFIRFGAGVDRYFHFGQTAVATTLALTSVLGTVTWSTSDSAVATVSDGTVTAVASGLCQITATDVDGNFETWTISVA